MYKLTIICAVLLLALGLGGYFGSGMASVTALIPAFFGLVLLIFALVSKDEKRRKLAMHIVMVVVLLGLLGSLTGIIQVFKMWGGAEIGRPLAAYSRAIMAVLMFVLLLTGVKSFIAARRKGA